MTLALATIVMANLNDLPGEISNPSPPDLQGIDSLNCTGLKVAWLPTPSAMTFLSPLQLCFEEGHALMDGRLRQTQLSQVSCLRVEMSED